MKHEFSVLMTTYKNDSPDYLKEAISSIYQNQNVKPSEIILIADGPLPIELKNVIQTQEKEISILKFFELEKNHGLAYALNFGIDLCNYELIFRMDSDDISLPNRFEKQISFMSLHPNIDICGSFVDIIEPETKKYLSTRKVPLEQNTIYQYSKKRSPMNHPSVVFRKKTIINNNYYPLFKKSQDYALWSKLLVNNVNFQNIPEVLVHMRGGDSLMNRRGVGYLFNEIKVISYQRSIGFLNNIEFLRNILLRTIFRIAPNSIKKVLYKIVNGK